MYVIFNLVLYVIYVFVYVESKNNIEWNSRSNVYLLNRGSCLKYVEIYKYIELEVYIYIRRFSYQKLGMCFIEIYLLYSCSNGYFILFVDIIKLY